MLKRLLPVGITFVLLVSGCTGSPTSVPAPPENAPATAEASKPAAAPQASAPEPAPETSPLPEATPEAPPAAPAESPGVIVDAMVGYYAGDGYDQRGEGYDWVGVTIEKIDDQLAYIRVRARGDKKRPTCIFDGVGIPEAANVLAVAVAGKTLRFALDGDSLGASVASPDDESLLFYPCSGGASLAGPYARLAEPLDASQLAPEAFSSVLSLQNVTFTLSANDSLPEATLVVRPEGLELDNRIMVQNVPGRVTGAEIEDLNSDGWPEVVVYTQSIEPGNPGSVIGFSVNNGKSVSAVAFPELTGDPAAGYRGHDEFSLVETSLARRFPVYIEGDADDKPGGGTRQIQYVLVDGEASRAFQVKDVMDFPAR